MTMNSEELDALISLIYDAALDDSLWPNVVRELTCLVDADDSYLFGPRMAEIGHSFTLSPLMNAGEEFAQDYEAHYWQLDVWMIQALKMGAVHSGNILHGDQLVERPDFLRTEIYNDFLKPKGLGIIMGGIVFDHLTPDYSPPILMCFYKKVSAAAFSASDELVFRTLMPHLQRSLRMRWQFQAQKEACQLRELALGQINSAILLLNQRGQIIFANPLAESMLKKGGSPIVRNNYLAGYLPHHHDAIQCAIRQAAAGMGSTLRLDNKPPHQVRIMTLSPVTASKGDNLKTSARVIVLLSEPDKPATGNLGGFAKLYRLTPAETRVLEQLLLQESTQDIADTLHIGIKTLRTQLSALFSKTQTKNQRDLIKFYLSHPMLSKAPVDAVRNLR